MYEGVFVNLVDFSVMRAESCRRLVSLVTTTLCSVRTGTVPAEAGGRRGGGVVIFSPSRLFGTIRMAKANDNGSMKSKPLVSKLQEIMNSDSAGGWEKSWEQKVTPWDLGQPTPVVLHLHQTGDLPKGRALVPGCGSGYDVVAIACPERYVVGLDISDLAVKKAKELSSSLPNASHCSFLKEDFFTWHPTELFDLIIDYTFFCAIEPEWRSAWAHRMSDLLKPDGELITLIFPISDHVGGPPYKVSVSDYEEVLHPLGFKATIIIDNELAIGPRKGKEKLGRWKRCVGQSLL